ncbi:MAG TPA: hypothetical protein VK448_07130 [Dissulfurispiraceae bacterium]|nr:hypothetical protein [Dissulfurispiraceae bacterium]
MKSGIDKRSRAKYLSGLIASIYVLLLTASCAYMKMNPPADVDKAFLPGNNSCYLATASNMLAGAGYGNGTTLQARANDIYGNMTANFGTASGGWADAAISWWLGSPNNVWPTNPYTVVTVYGNKSPKYPWANTNGAQFIGNQLRECNFVGLSISWPTADASIGSGGHAITAWGDNSGNGTLSSNPANIRVTDSDSDTGGDVQSYVYDDYTNPNPGGANEGNGWYFNYDPNHPYIKHIVVLSPATNASGTKLAQRVTGSYKIHQDQQTNATDLHYNVGTDVNILSYKTTIDWNTGNSPSITEASPRRSLTVDWNLSDKPVPYCTWVTVTTEFILPYWNSIHYNNIYFTYPERDKLRKVPSIKWKVESPVIEKAGAIRNVTGGYVIGSFNIINRKMAEGKQVIGEYRFIHQYSFNQSPEEHTLIMSGEKGYEAVNFRFGHSYGYLEPASLWRFKEWMTNMNDKIIELDDKEASISISWPGRLPYPEGEDITGRIPNIKPRPTDDKR